MEFPIAPTILYYVYSTVVCMCRSTVHTIAVTCSMQHKCTASIASLNICSNLNMTNYNFLMSSSIIPLRHVHIQDATPLITNLDHLLQVETSIKVLIKSIHDLPELGALVGILQSQHSSQLLSGNSGGIPVAKAPCLLFHTEPLRTKQFTQHKTKTAATHKHMVHKAIGVMDPRIMYHKTHHNLSHTSYPLYIVHEHTRHIFSTIVSTFPLPSSTITYLSGSFLDAPSSFSNVASILPSMESTLLPRRTDPFDSSSSRLLHSSARSATSCTQKQKNNYFGSFHCMLPTFIAYTRTKNTSKL